MNLNWTFQLVVAGVLGIVTWTKRNRGAMIAFLVLCIISCIVGVIQALVAGIVHAQYTRCSTDDRCYINLLGGLLAFIILSAFGAFFSLAGSIIGCKSACGGQQTAGTVIVQQPAVVMQSYPEGYPQQPGGYPVLAYVGPEGYPQQPGGYPAQFHVGPKGYPQQPGGYPAQAYAGPEGYPQQPGGYPAQAYVGPAGHPQQLQPGGYPAQAYAGPAGPVPPQYREKEGTP
ncbi:hypothetical protein QZH41_012339 [Actinostola sp. cb2023]|nr:hypothetical protein QZH41_012339 [Actinostola sp. cb2023]